MKIGCLIMILNVKVFLGVFGWFLSIFVWECVVINV